MAYRYDKVTGDIVWSGAEQGIAPSPEKGIADLKCLNITTFPGEVCLNYSRTRQSPLVETGGSLSALTSSTVSGTSDLIRGNWIHITSSSITNLTNGSNYYVKSNTAGTIVLSATYEGSTLSTLSVTGVASYNNFPMGQPIAYAIDNFSNSTSADGYYVLDATGQVWKNPPGNGTGGTLGTWTLIDASPVANITSTAGLFVYGGFIHAVTDKVYYKPISNLAAAWTAVSGAASNTINGYHYSLLGHDSVVYMCDGSYINTLTVVPGQTYDPSNSATFTYSAKALALPLNEAATRLAEIAVGSGTQILIGGLFNVIYPWDKLSPFYGPLIYMPENYTQNMLTVNNLVFVFAGSKGNVYLTNGSSLTTVLTVPDYIANNTGTNNDPYFIWGGAMYLRGRVWFSVKASNCGGIWSFVPTVNYYIQQDTGASLRLEAQNSYGTYSGYATLLFSPQVFTDQNANGPQYYSAWDDGSGGASPVHPYGIDFSATTPFTGGAIIETELIPTGTMLDKETFQQVEYKLAAPLVAGESIQIYYRTNLTTAFATMPSVVPDGASTTGALSGYFAANFEKTQWLQLQVILTGTTSSPSWMRLVEMRIR